MRRAQVKDKRQLLLSFGTGAQLSEVRDSVFFFSSGEGFVVEWFALLLGGVRLKLWRYVQVARRRHCGFLWNMMPDE